MPGSKLFQRNRALGYVSNHVPASIHYMQNRQENIIITCVGRSFHVYSCNHFRLICVSALHPDEISCVASDSRYTYSAAGNDVYVWRSGVVVKHFLKGHKKKIHLLLPFGNEHLIAIDTDSTLKVWNIETESEFCELAFNNDEFKISAVLHPPTFLNKILLGSEQGSLQLWNIKQCKLVYTFKPFSSKICVLEAAPAIDVCAIGLLDGDIVLLNLKYDEYVMEFKQDWGPVTAISFRTDGHPLMITASTNGQIVVWNLEERQIANQFTAHTDSVATAFCLQSEPLLFTSSRDNSIKLWIFDLPDGGARLLRIREGHSAPPVCIKYHGASGKTILSADEDATLRAMSTVSDTLNKSFGQASYNRKASKKRNKFEVDPFKMPPIVNFTSEVTREKEWDNIAAIHSGLVVATTWSFHKSKMGNLKLVPEQFHSKSGNTKSVEATCIALTHCGNFVIIGYSSGDVERFNIQSGQHRQRYGETQPAHQTCVRGVYADNLNHTVVSGDNDGVIKFWHFKGKAKFPYSKLELPSGINLFKAHSESSMLAIALESYTVDILDCDTKTVIRQFVGHSGRITDACFSPNSRWLITAAMDCTIKIWDIPSAYMIDHFRVDMACVSLSISPTGDFLATAHVNYLGLYLWANKSLFKHVALNPIDPESLAPLIDLPVANEHALDVEPLENGHESSEEIEKTYESPAQINKDLITMSALALSRWQNLLSLDIIKMRNKPKQPINTPKHAQFFLPTVSGLDFKFDLSKEQNQNANDSAKIIHSESFSNLTTFGKLLDKSVKTNRFEDCVKHITSLGPSMIDFEIKSLGPAGGGNLTILLQFMKMINFMFDSNLNFELAQSYLAVFLKEQGQNIVDEPQHRNYLKLIEAAQNKRWKLLEKQLLYGMAVASESRLYTV